MGPDLRAVNESSSRQERHKDKDSKRSAQPSRSPCSLYSFQPKLKPVCSAPHHEVGRKKVDYFRGKDFKKFLLESEGILTKKCSKALEEALDGQVPQADQDVVRLGQELIDRKFCYKAILRTLSNTSHTCFFSVLDARQAMYKPLNPSSKSDDGAEKKPKKWPDRLGRTPNQAFDSEGCWPYT